MTDQLEVEFFEEPHIYTVAGEPWRSVTQVVGSALGNPYERVKPEILEPARMRGKRIDTAILYYNEGDLDWNSIHDGDRPWIQSYIDWQKATGFKPDTKRSQKIVLLEDLKVAGTPDLPGTLFEKTVLIDLKSVAKIQFKHLAAQTAGYCLGMKEIWRDRYGLKLIPGKMAKLVPCKNPDDFAAFRAMCTVHAWRNGK